MLWLVVWLGATAQVLARPSHGATDPSTFHSERASNYSFHISVERLEVQNVNFNVHLAVFLGGPAHYPAHIASPSYQPPREQHLKPVDPPVTTAALGPGDYGRYAAAPFVLAYPLTPWTAGGWRGGAASGNSPPLASPPSHQAPGDLRREDHSIPPPQQYTPPTTLLQTITTTPPPQYPAFDTHVKELTTMSPLYLDHVTGSEKLITTSPPQYPDLETHSATSETLQTL